MGMKGAACFFLPRSITDNFCSHPTSDPAWLLLEAWFLLEELHAVATSSSLWMALQSCPLGLLSSALGGVTFPGNSQEVIFTTCHGLWEPCHVPPWETRDPCPSGAGVAGKPTKGTSQRPHKVRWKTSSYCLGTHGMQSNRPLRCTGEGTDLSETSSLFHGIHL